MVFAAEAAADLRQTTRASCALQTYIATWRGIATDFALLRDRKSAGLRLVVIRHLLLNLFDRDRFLFVIDHVAQHFLREFDRERLCSSTKNTRSIESAASFEFADVGLHARSR